MQRDGSGTPVAECEQGVLAQVEQQEQHAQQVSGRGSVYLGSCTSSRVHTAAERM